MQDEKKQKYLLEEQYKWRKSVVLTLTEGETLDAILAQHECNNLSQLCKKIIKGEILLTKRNE